MPRPRKELIDLARTTFYHCVSRCVRRSYLCGKDKLTGTSYEHRRQWVEDKLMFLSTVFAIDIAAYAVMSNHTHVVLQVSKDTADAWSIRDIFTRWHNVFRGTPLTQRFMKTGALHLFTQAEQRSLAEKAELYRSRLYDISWFMRLLNEHIAREANREDNCTGRFWEGRFKSQALIGEQAITACMVYVDLNPIRAKMAGSLETSAHTSIFHRLKAQKKGRQPHSLLPFAGNPRANMPEGLPFHLSDYIRLVKHTAKTIQHPTTSPTSRHPTLLTRINISGDIWLFLSQHFEQVFGAFADVQRIANTFKPDKSINRQSVA